MKVFAIVLVALAAVFAGWSGWMWLRSANAADAATDTRQEVQRVGEQGIANLTTLDFQHIDEGLDRWLESSTGTLRDSLLQSRDESRKRLEEGKSSTVGKVVDAAVTDIDQQNAQVIAAVEVTVTPQGGESSVRRNRFEAGLSRTESGWKLSSLRAVEVGAQ